MFDRSITQSFGVVACEDNLNGAEEVLDEFGFLIVEALANAVTDRDAAIFEFEEGDRDAVDVENEVGAFGLFAFYSDFFGDGEVVAIGHFPVDEVQGLGRFAGIGFDGDAVAKKFVDGLVVVVEAAVGVVGFGAEFVEGLGNLGGAVGLGEVGGEVGFFEVAVVGAILPVAEVGIAEFAFEEFDDAVLGGAFGLSDVAHGGWRGEDYFVYEYYA